MRDQGTCESRFLNAKAKKKVKEKSVSTIPGIKDLLERGAG